jgi:metal-sulfur cluster biosynthetic enzyme
MSIITNDRIKCDKAISVLKYVLDPEIGLNVIDLGLIYHINFDETNGNKIYILMTLTVPYCPMSESITSDIKSVLENTFTNSTVIVELTFDPPWSSEFISKEGNYFLNQ